MAKSRKQSSLRARLQARLRAGVVAGCLVVCGGDALLAAAPPSVAQVLQLKPKQDGVPYGTPAPQDQANCKVEPDNAGTRGGGWVLKDANGRPLRRFIDSNGDGKIDTYSYYQDGVEIYRELDSQFAGKVDQYRWFNACGMKWGFDYNGDHVVDAWKVISAEEVSQEVLQALVTKNYARLQALWISDVELKQLNFPAAEETRIRDLQKGAPAKFQATASKLAGLNAQTRWVRLDTAGPQCIPAAQFGGKSDLLKHSQSTIICETSGKTELIQAGEMIQVGLAWRLVDAPSPGGDATTTGDSTTAKAVVDPAVQKLLDELRDLDKRAPQASEGPGPNAGLARYNLDRAELLERILAKSKADERDQWIKQLADCLSAAAQSSPKEDKVVFQRLVALEEKTAKETPGSALAGYVTFREMQADYAGKLTSSGQDFTKVQEQWLDRLKQFVNTYPRCDDAADALLQLGMVSEFVGKEIEAKAWYQQLAKNFPDRHPLSDKAKGALTRLELDGKLLELSGPTLDGSTRDIAQLRGKVVVVYYWASWNQQCLGDFAKLKILLNSYAAKGLELLCVNLDTTADEAQAYLKRSPTPGTHLFQPGGLESPLATQYGVVVLPNLFLIGADGKCLSRTVQMSNLEEELKKQLK